MKFYVHFKDADSDIVCAVDTSGAICVSDFLQVCLMNKFLLANALTQTMLKQNAHLIYSKRMQIFLLLLNFL